MKKEETFRTLTFEQTRENYAGISAIALPALRTTIEELAKQHDNELGPWFDELEAKLISDAKGTISEGFAINTEASMIGVGIEALQMMLDTCRSSIGNKK